MRTFCSFITYSCLAIALTSATVETSTGIRESWLVEIRVDDDCRIWWNTRFVKPDNLPKLLPPDSLNAASSVYVVDFNALFGLVESLIRQEPKRLILLSIHPDAHYICADNVLAVLAMVQNEYNDLTARRLQMSVDSLSGGNRLSLRYGIEKWSSRDDRILSAAMNSCGLVDSLAVTLPVKQTFEYQRKAGHWKDRSAHMYGFDILLIPPPTRPSADDSLENPLLKYVEP
ncbi:MAG: hypothetical protein OEV49_06830 [candidate division Zixibacteria bacterium]|nr:hypothetical protein [candidate division Zixibacteria bacterium]MDH3935737.1 hypothetical protein [candidate division Zixibacteria bacterium]MDH4033230.1 hypothetical protein [candidate division Zixibacteria bacterium]